MTFTNFLQVLAFNLLTSTIPFCLLIYFAIRVAMSHGIFKTKFQDNVEAQIEELRKRINILEQK